MAFAKEQLDRSDNGRGRGRRKWSKRQMNRSERRQAKKNPQASVGRRTYKGYET
jgi:hypothetical protein